jgi:hypothetical protein
MVLYPYVQTTPPDHPPQGASKKTGGVVWTYGESTLRVEGV